VRVIEKFVLSTGEYQISGTVVWGECKKAKYTWILSKTWVWATGKSESGISHCHSGIILFHHTLLFRIATENENWLGKRRRMRLLYILFFLFHCVVKSFLKKQGILSFWLYWLFNPKSRLLCICMCFKVSFARGGTFFDLSEPSKTGCVL